MSDSIIFVQFRIDSKCHRKKNYNIKIHYFLSKIKISIINIVRYKCRLLFNHQSKSNLLNCQNFRLFY